jgi:hypothetical protein
MYQKYAGKIMKMMNQYDCENEFYLLTAQFGEKSKKKLKYEDGQQMQSMVRMYKDDAYNLFTSKTEKLPERRKIASACYYFVYSKQCAGRSKMAFLSFPWIFYEYLL